jgi:hypothetical protein
MFGIGQKRGTAKAAAKPATLHSIAAMMRGRSFAGYFNIGGGNYNYYFTYSPAKAAVAGGKLEITGGLRLAGAGSNFRNTPHELRDVRATLVAAQGGIGTAPPRKKLPAEIAPASPDLPIVESTGSLSFCGVLYFKLAPLDGRALGVPADMRQLQLNARIAPVSDVERGLQAAFSSIVDALYGNQVDEKGAEAAISELNKLLSGS